MPLATANLPDDLAAAHAMILAERAARLEAEAAVSSARLEIERLRLLLAKARREQYGRSSERGARLIEQLELQLAELPDRAAALGAGAGGRIDDPLAWQMLGQRPAGRLAGAAARR